MSKNYIEIKNHNLAFVFGELGEREIFTVTFQRTLRIPDDNKKYPLPPGLGSFPLAHVQDYSNTVPAAWNEHGGIFFPMYQAEAMWMRFSSNSGRPFAVKIATGKVNAVSGEPWDNQLHGKSQSETSGLTRSDAWENKEHKPDYMVCPKQPWLDGFNVGKGIIRQFVAVPLHSGYTVEEQVTGKAEFGGVQIIAYPMKDEVWNKMKEAQARSVSVLASASLCGGMLRSVKASSAGRSMAPDMGLGAGGMMTQDIYEDTYGLDAWDTQNPLRVFVHLANSEQYLSITGKNPPASPATPETYQRYSLPWFEYYSDEPVLSGSETLAKVDSIASMQIKKNEKILPDDGIKPGTGPIVPLNEKKKVTDKKNW